MAEETDDSATEVTGQPVPPPTFALAASPPGDDALCQDESPEKKKAAAKAEAACSSVSAENVAMLTDVLSAEKASGKTRGGSIKVAKGWCREKDILDGGHERCISALSRKLWQEELVLEEERKREDVAETQRRKQRAEKWNAEQAELLDSIEILLNRGVFKKVDFGIPPTVWVGPEFYALPFDVREAACSAVSAYLGSTAEQTGFIDVTLKDFRSGKRVGSYGVQGFGFGGFGLKME